MSRSTGKRVVRLPGFIGNWKSTVVLALLLLVALSVNANGQGIIVRSQRDPLVGSLQYADIYAEGNIAVMGTYSGRGVLIYDITNPDAPVLANHYNPSVPSPTTPNTQQMLEAVVVNGIGYFGSGNGGGVHVVNLANPYSPVLITRINAANGGGYNTIHEIVVDGNFLYETDSRVNSNPGPAVVKVINISNPAVPVFVRNIVTTDSVFVHAIHVKNGKMFTSAWGGKTDIYDITNVGTQAPPLLGVINSGNNSHSNWITDDGNYLYNARELVDGDLRVYNISNPAAPVLVKSINAASLGINAICPHNPVVMGNLLFVAWYHAGIQVFDIRNPADPVRIGQYDTFPGAFNRTEALERQAAEPWDMVCGFDDLTEALPTTYDGNWAVFPFLGLNKVILGDLAGGLFIIDVTPILPSTSRNRFADFDGDGKTDVSQFRPDIGTWFIQKSLDNSIDSRAFGLATDILTPGDYDGDGKTDIAVFRPSDGTWYMLQSLAGFKAQQFGANGDIPVAGYFDSDNRTDTAVFRPSTGTWYAMRSTSGFLARQWGSLNDKPVVGDFDGDNLADMGVYRPSEGTWYILTSSNGALLSRQFGTSTDMPLLGDFDGDGNTDFTVFRPTEGTWYMLRSSNGGFSAQQFGVNGDVPVAGDYDGDGKSDLAVFRPSDTYWYIIKSSNSSFEARQFGAATDRPVLTGYYPQ